MNGIATEGARSAGGGATWASAWALSILPLTAPLGTQLGSEVSRSALVLLPWLALIGLPRARAGGSGLAVPLALLAGPLAVGLHLDLGRGAAVGELAWTAVPALSMAALLGVAAARAAGRPVTRAVYGALWLGVVAGVPIAAAVLGWGGAPGGGGAAFLDLVATSSPLDWLVRRASGESGEAGRGGGAAALWRPLAVAVGLCAVSFLVPSGARAAPGEGLQS